MKGKKTKKAKTSFYGKEVNTLKKPHFVLIKTNKIVLEHRKNETFKKWPNLAPWKTFRNSKMRIYSKYIHFLTKIE